MRTGLLLLGLAFCTGAPAQSTDGLSIPAIDRPPTLADFAGMEPSTEMRQSMALVSDFVQRLPDDSDPATERTDVYLGYDNRNLYAVFLAFDSQPDLIRANLSPRENIENADYFRTETQLVFTRRIVDPEAGARFTGRLGDWGIGTMLMNDEAPGQVREPADPLFGESADISVFRAFRDISEQSRVGMLYTDRQFGDASNTVLSVDGRFKLNDNWTTRMQLTDTEKLTEKGQRLDGNKKNIRFDRSGRRVAVHTHIINSSEDFRADLGFFNRNYVADTNGYHIRVTLTHYPENGRVNSWSPAFYFSHLDDQSGTRIAQHEQTVPGVMTRLDLGENMNWDLLARYVLNPWSALYVGYNSNSSNFDLIDTEFGTELVTTTDLRRDGRQIFAKFSFLFQP